MAVLDGNGHTAIRAASALAEWPLADDRRSSPARETVDALASRPVEITLADGDRLRVEDSVPEGWSEGCPSAVLVHGLAGSSGSPYMVRLASRLVAMGVRVVRMNLRGAGDGFGLSRGIYHAGRTGDVRAVAEWLASAAPGSPIALVGFSLGGNLVLKLAAEASEEPLEGFDCVAGGERADRPGGLLPADADALAADLRSELRQELAD